MKLVVNAVIGGGEKLIFDIPKHMRNKVSICPGDVISIEQLKIWDEISRAQDELGDKCVEIDVPVSCFDGVDIENNTINTEDFLKVLSKYVEPESSQVPFEERMDLMDAIFNSGRAVKDPIRKRR